MNIEDGDIDLAARSIFHFESSFESYENNVNRLIKNKKPTDEDSVGLSIIQLLLAEISISLRE
ncbi:hypothetical protein F0226_21440 [Vibrio sp. 99-70-13A1]|nr:hypothetical protein [Vibrio sp. 99-70-13A1]